MSERPATTANTKQAPARLDTTLRLAEVTGMHFYDTELLRPRPHTHTDPEVRRLDITLTNSGREAQTFFANNQKLFDSERREYVRDATAAAWVNSEGRIADLNPGFAVTVKVPFDMPPGLRPERIELHDSAFSQGVSVKLNQLEAVGAWGPNADHGREVDQPPTASLP